MATCLSFVHPASGVWTLVDDELFLPEHWLSPAYAPLREEVGVPASRTMGEQIKGHDDGVHD